MIRSLCSSSPPWTSSLAPFLNSVHLQFQLIAQLVAIAVLLSASNNPVAAAKAAGKASVSAFVPPHVGVGASANFLRMSERSNNHEENNDMDGYYCGEEIMEPLRMTTREEDSAGVVRYQSHNDDDGTDDDNFNDLNLKSNNEGQSKNNNAAANNMFQEKTEDDNGSEDNNP